MFPILLPAAVLSPAAVRSRSQSALDALPVNLLDWVAVIRRGAAPDVILAANSVGQIMNAMSEENSSPIKTPKQLVLVVLLAFAVTVAIIGMIVFLVTSGSSAGKNSPAMSEDAIARRLQPVGQVVVADADAPKTERSGKEVVDAVCAACHGTGVLGAPKIGDKAAWGKLIAEGLPELVSAATKGVRQMPPRGGNPSLTDTEITRAVVYMANQAGANFKEPVAKPTPAAKSAAAAPAKPDAKSIYEKTCAVCHATGAAGAPKAGDKAAWAPRLKTGMSPIYNSVLQGKGAMPPKGGNASLSDADVKAAADYLTSLAK
jgi:cytochrome c5